MKLKFDKYFFFWIGVICLFCFDIYFYYEDLVSSVLLNSSVKEKVDVNFLEDDHCIKYYKKQNYVKYNNFSFDLNSKNVVFPGCSLDLNYNGDLYITIPNLEKDHCIYDERDIENFKNKKLIAFTFDDGPSNKNTNKLLDKLDCYQARVTFFVVGNRLYSTRDTLKRAYDMGNQIGSHTYSHVNLTKVSDDKIRSEINNTNNLIKNIIGVDPSLIRPPYGSVNTKVNDLINESIILWNVDTLDWKYKDVEKVKEEILKYAEDGAIVLLHDLYETSVDGAILAMDELITQGYAFVTIDEMAKLRDVKLNNSKVYRYIE